VAGHHRLHAGRDRGPERHQLAGLELGTAAVDDRDRVVRVDRGVTVAREVFGARRHAGRLQATDERTAVPGDQIGFGAERAYPDHRVVGVAVDVGVRGVVQGDARVRQIESQVAGDRLGQHRIVDRTERQVAGPGTAVPRLEAGDVTGFLVDGHDDLGTLGPQLRGQRGDLGRRLDVAGEQRDPAETFTEPAAHPVGHRRADESGLQHGSGKFRQFAIVRHGPPYLR
jgi:hypothetical protein